MNAISPMGDYFQIIPGQSYVNPDVLSGIEQIHGEQDLLRENIRKQLERQGRMIDYRNDQIMQNWQAAFNPIAAQIQDRNQQIVAPIDSQVRGTVNTLLSSPIQQRANNLYSVLQPNPQPIPSITTPNFAPTNQPNTPSIPFSPISSSTTPTPNYVDPLAPSSPYSGLPNVVNSPVFAFPSGVPASTPTVPNIIGPPLPEPIPPIPQPIPVPIPPVPAQQQGCCRVENIVNVPPTQVVINNVPVVIRVVENRVGQPRIVVQPATPDIQNIIQTLPTTNGKPQPTTPTTLTQPADIPDCRDMNPFIDLLSSCGIDKFEQELQALNFDPTFLTKTNDFVELDHKLTDTFYKKSLTNLVGDEGG